MDALFLKNISAIAKRNEDIAGIIRKAEYTPHCEVITSKTGHAVPIVKTNEGTISVHSKFDPLKEAERMMEEYDCALYDFIVISGFGFGYHIDNILHKAKPDSTILVLEQFPWMVKAAASHRNMEKIFIDSRLILLINPDEDAIAQYMKGRSSYKTLFITHRGSFQIDPEKYINLQRIAKAYIAAKEVNIATLAKFEKLWTANIARNIHSIIHSVPANAFFERFKNVPAIIVNAGPTVNDSIPFIKKNYDSALIIAVDTSLKILEQYDIEPHFCITVDPQLINARYFEGTHSSNTVVIADPMVHPSTFIFHKGRKAFTNVVFEMMRWIEESTGNYGSLRYGGSVSTNAYDFAKRLGANPIVMVGQDLSFTKGLAHGKGAYLDEHVFLRTYRSYTAEMFNRYQLTALPKIYVKGIKSKQVHTNQKMIIFISWFSKLNDRNLINASHDGSYIDNIAHRDAEDLDFQPLSFSLWELVHTLYGGGIPSHEIITSRSDYLIEKLTEMLSHCSAMNDLLNKAIYYCNSLMTNMKNNKGGGVASFVKKLDEIDKQIYTYTDTKNMVGLTVQHIIHTITEGYEIDDAVKNEHERIVHRSLYLYNGLSEGVCFSARVIEKMIAVLKR